MAFCALPPMETNAITAAVPIMMAKAVRIDLSKLAFIASNAEARDSSGNIRRGVFL
jgi:hypothetical protein